MHFILIESVPSSAKVFLVNGVDRTLIGSTPLQLDRNEFWGSQIIVAYDSKEKAVYLDPNIFDFYVDFQEVTSDFNKYGIYLNSQLQYVNINQFEDLLRSGHRFDTIYVDSKMKMLSELPELKVINDRYFPNVNSPDKHTADNPNQNSTSQNTTSDYTLVYVLLGILLLGGLVWFISSASKKKEIGETGLATDSVAVSNVDSSAYVVDSAAIVADSTPDMITEQSAVVDSAAVTAPIVQSGYALNYYARLMNDYCSDLSNDNYDKMLLYYEPIVRRFLNYNTPHTSDEIVQSHVDYHAIYPFHIYEIVGAEIYKEDDNQIRIMFDMKTEIKKNSSENWKTFYAKYVYTFNKTTDKIIDVVKY